MPFELRQSEKPNLDVAEGLGHGYLEKIVTLMSHEGEDCTAVTYYPNDKDVSLRPYSWYIRFVIEGAKQHELRAAYISAIEAVSCTEDPNRQRDREQRAIQC